MQPTFIRDLITHPVTRPAMRDPKRYQLRQAKAIVIHWTANEARGADARANRNYFNNGAPGPGGRLRPASAHYIVDQDNVIQALPDTEVAFHCGDKPLGEYKAAGKKLIQGTRLTPNYFTIGIELCVNADGNWQKTCDNGAILAASLMHKHGLNMATDLVRHYDVTGKQCPRPLLSAADWLAFVGQVYQYYQQFQTLALRRAIVDADELNVRIGPGIQYPVRYTLLKNEPVLTDPHPQNGWVCIGYPDQWVNAKYLRAV